MPNRSDVQPNRLPERYSASGIMTAPPSKRLPPLRTRLTRTMAVEGLDPGIGVALAWIIMDVKWECVARVSGLVPRYGRGLLAAALVVCGVVHGHVVRAEGPAPEDRKGSRVDVAVDEYRKGLGLELHAGGEVERSLEPAPMRCRISSADGAVVVDFDASRVGSLASDVKVSYPSPSTGKRREIVIRRKDVTGYYFVHNRLLVYYSTLVDDREAILDLEYDVEAAKGTVSVHLSPVAVSGREDLREDAGKVAFEKLPTGQLEVVTGGPR